jgi:hypothetical protein
MTRFENWLLNTPQRGRLGREDDRGGVKKPFRLGQVSEDGTDGKGSYPEL